MPWLAAKSLTNALVVCSCSADTNGVTAAIYLSQVEDSSGMGNRRSEGWKWKVGMVLSCMGSCLKGLPWDMSSRKIVSASAGLAV